MSDRLPQYWQTLAERARKLDPEELSREFPEELPVGPLRQPFSFDRRGFFKAMGLSAAAALAACQRAPKQKILPFVRKPEEVTPGVPLWYASTCAACPASCGILLKVRDGRPIKVEGNEAHPLSSGGVCAAGQASLLSLYDASRARGPSFGGTPTSWAALDEAVRRGLLAAKAQGRPIRLLLPWVLGPSAEAAVARFLEVYPTAKTVRYEAIPAREPIASAHRETHGAFVVPDYRFEKAKVIASFGADFLGTWLSPVAFTRQYSAGRSPEAKRMSKHFQLEAAMSLTGSNADRRLVLPPSDFAPALGALVSLLAQRSAHPQTEAIAPAAHGPRPALSTEALEEVASALLSARGEALVVCGSGSLRAQLLANAANELLGAYGHTLSLELGLPLDGLALPFEDFLAELRSGAVGALVALGVNPVYSHPRGEELSSLLSKPPLSVCASDRLDETAAAMAHHAATHSFLEDWGDEEPRRGLFSVRQPAVAPLFDTRGPFESLLAWAGIEQGWYDFLRARWEREVFPRSGAASFEPFWEGAVQLGVADLPSPAEPASFRLGGLEQALSEAPPPSRKDGLELFLYPKVSIGDGSLANNGWLQELPDPITKATWGNYVQLSPPLAASMGIEEGRMLTVSTEAGSLTLPAQVQVGLHPRVVAVALGYGRTKAGTVANGVGRNAYPLATEAGRVSLAASGASLSLAEGKKKLALSQTHHSAEGRPIVKQASFGELLADPRAGNEAEELPTRRSMWPLHSYLGRRWGMAVDLTACTGCASCIVSCQAENNISVVGEEEVRRRREMHWLRIDRYYAGPPEAPEVVHQPMMCQHCENAPCETVCPVLATVHSGEGLNQQVYNRCVGTRYCANNCPPKVRRFNWFDYPHADPLERMVLNPEVAVRTRGVMEKCSMCIQRIEEEKARAKREGRPLLDGEVRTACQQSCPAKAIVFGDLNDPKSEVSRLIRLGRAYKLFEELNAGSQVSYLTRIRNT
ncbi:MAG: 4Fe-4S dicluster domain-containing protein [Myxococcales bacterium]|nr:4Fe-4S dicluster domain-containing protein [Myxococcales bacterium]